MRHTNISVMKIKNPKLMTSSLNNPSLAIDSKMRLLYLSGKPLAKQIETVEMGTFAKNSKAIWMIRMIFGLESKLARVRRTHIMLR